MAFVSVVCLVGVSVLLFGGVSPQNIHSYSRAGGNTTLPCKHQNLGSTCTNVEWLFYKGASSQPMTLVSDGEVQGSESSRLTLNSDCSLSLKNVSEEDSGAFRCDLYDHPVSYTSVYLNVLTVSPAPADRNNVQHETITLQCSLWMYGESFCNRESFRWFDQNQEVFSGEQNNCVSYLTVERQSQDNRTFSCRFVEGSEEKVSAEYRLKDTHQTQDPGVSSQPIDVERFSRAGEGTMLPCDRAKQHVSTCSHVRWLYKRNISSQLIFKARDGNTVSSGSSRLTLNHDCSLSLQNVTEADSGQFVCRLFEVQSFDTSVYLSILTVSQAPENSNEQLDGNITLQCRLGTYDADSCDKGRFRWFDQNQVDLPGQKKKCVFCLSVKRQSQDDRTFTCEFEKSSDVKISAEYKLKGSKEIDQSKNSGDSGNNMYIIAGAVVSLLVLLVVAAVVLFKIKSKKRSPNTTEATDLPPTHQPTDPVDDPESGLTYAMINHSVPKPKKQQVEAEDTVTYSAVSIKTAPDSNSAIYSTVKKNSNGRTIA